MNNEVARNIEKYIPALQRYAVSMTRNSVAADDLVQECVVRALTKARLYRPGTNLRAWLFTILHNLHISEVRRARQWRVPLDPDAALAQLSVPPTQTGTVMLRTVHQAIMALPDQQRQILYSIAFDEKSYDEAAAEMGIPLGTVKSRYSRARRALQLRLGQINEREPEPRRLVA